MTATVEVYDFNFKQELRTPRRFKVSDFQATLRPRMKERLFVLLLAFKEKKGQPRIFLSQGISTTNIWFRAFYPTNEVDE